MDPYPFDDVRGHFVCALWHELAPIRIRSFQLLQESQWGRPWTQSFSLMALHSEGCVLIRQAAHAPVTSALGELSHRLQTLRYAQALIWPWQFFWHRHKLCWYIHKLIILHPKMKRKNKYKLPIFIHTLYMHLWVFVLRKKNQQCLCGVGWQYSTVCI